MEVWVNDEKARIGLQYQYGPNCKYDYTFILNEGKEEWADKEEELSQPSIRSVWKMPLRKGVELIRKMSMEIARNPTIPISEKQKKFLHWISKLEQLIDKAVHALVEEVNSWEILAY